MTTVFLPFVSTLSAAAELLQLVADVSLLLLGVRLASAILDTLARLAAALRWIAELTLLAIALVLSVLGDVAPIVGRHAGRLAGRTVAAGAAAGRAYRRHLQPTVNALVHHLDQTGRAFVLEQLGTAYPAVSKAIAPSIEPIALVASSSPVEQPQPSVVPAAPLTRRQLLQLARERKLPGYSRLSTAQLREAIAA